MHLQQEQVKIKCMLADSQGQTSKRLWCGQEDGQEKEKKKQQKSQHGCSQNDVTTGFHKLVLFSGTTGPFLPHAHAAGSKSAHACNVHTGQPPSKQSEAEQVSRGRRKGGRPCHKMPRSFTVKSTRRRRRRRTRKRKNTTAEVASRPGENKSSQRLQGCRLLLATATKLMRFLAPLFFHRRTAHTHTHSTGKQAKEKGGAVPPPVPL